MAPTGGPAGKDSPAGSGASSTESPASLSAKSAVQSDVDQPIDAKKRSSGSDHAVASAASLDDSHQQRNDLNTIGKSPGEIAFFKLLHAEFKKASHFFERAQQEYIIREERVRNLITLMQQHNYSILGN